jgi:hypothetical protein
MKRPLILSLFVLLFCSGIKAQGNGNQQQTPDQPKNAIVFKEMVYNFKEVEYGSDVSHSFVFTNNSNAPVTIKDVTTSCGCTTTDYTKGPIMPGKSGTVSIKYDSTREGYFAKLVTVKIGEDSFTLSFLGTVKKAPTDDNVQPKNN